MIYKWSNLSKAVLFFNDSQISNRRKKSPNRNWSDLQSIPPELHQSNLFWCNLFVQRVYYVQPTLIYIGLVFKFSRSLRLNPIRWCNRADLCFLRLLEQMKSISVMTTATHCGGWLLEGISVWPVIDLVDLYLELGSSLFEEVNSRTKPVVVNNVLLTATGEVARCAL